MTTAPILMTVVALAAAEAKTRPWRGDPLFRRLAERLDRVRSIDNHPLPAEALMVRSPKHRKNIQEIQVALKRFLGEAGLDDIPMDLAAYLSFVEATLTRWKEQGAVAVKLWDASAFGTRKAMPVYMEKSILDLPKVYLNGGSRGLLVGLAPQDIVRVLAPIPVDVAVAPGR